MYMSVCAYKCVCILERKYMREEASQCGKISTTGESA